MAVPDFSTPSQPTTRHTTRVKFPFIFHLKFYLRITCGKSFACECSLKSNFHPLKPPTILVRFHICLSACPWNEKKESSSFPCVVFIHCSEKSNKLSINFLLQLNLRLSMCLTPSSLSAWRRQASRKVERTFSHFLDSLSLFRNLKKNYNTLTSRFPPPALQYEENEIYNETQVKGLNFSRKKNIKNFFSGNI